MLSTNCGPRQLDAYAYRAVKSPAAHRFGLTRAILAARLPLGGAGNSSR